MTNIKQRLWVFLPLLLVTIIFIFLQFGLSIDPHRLPSTLLDRPAPEFNLPELSNQRKHFTQNDFKGHYSLLNVWASWCNTCRMEHPVLLDIAMRENIKIYGLNYKDKRELAAQWLQDYGNPYTQSGYDPSGKVAMDWGVYGTPETYLIDPQGIVRYKHIGPMTQAVWKAEFLPLIL